MKNILIITHNQFGYQVSEYQYARILKEYYNVKYLCFDYGRHKIYESGVKVKYITKRGNRIFQLIRFIKSIKEELLKDYNVIILKYFPFCFLVNTNKDSKIVLDIRTGSVSKYKLKNIMLNIIIKLDSLYFKNIITLSESLRRYLGLNENKTTIVPFGSNIISRSKKTFDRFDLIYVGTFDNRRIDKTIKGLHKLLREKNVDRDIITYNIVGTGNRKNTQYLNYLIKYLDLNDVVKLSGYVPYKNLGPYHDSSNVGISFIPITNYYHYQPPSKTYEYLLSGMPVLATDTYENRRIINETNGILINDDVDSIFKGLYKLYSNRFIYDSESIRNSMLECTWDNIINNLLLPYTKYIQSINEKKT